MTDGRQVVERFFQDTLSTFCYLEATGAAGLAPIHCRHPPDVPLLPRVKECH